MKITYTGPRGPLWAIALQYAISGACKLTVAYLSFLLAQFLQVPEWAMIAMIAVAANETTIKWSDK